MAYTQDLLIDCPHACVNKLRARVEINHHGNVTGVTFLGHEHTHDEWTGRPLPPAETPAALEPGPVEGES